jgi:peptidoglycan-associated lipoprotein
MEPMMRIPHAARFAATLMFTALVVSGCHKNPPPVARPTPPPEVATPPPATASTAPAASAAAAPPRPPAPPAPVSEPTIVPPEPAVAVREDAISSASLDELNRNSPLKPVFFDYDSSELSNDAQAALKENAATLSKYNVWVVTIEGHCDERGTPEYNLALGERRAVAARAYLVSLGVSADRLHTVSYGREFPFEPGHDEAAYSKNRRAHFVVTAK